MRGEGGNDTMYGGAGNDILNGGTGNDKIYDTEGDNIWTDNDGGDYWETGKGKDQFNVVGPTLNGPIVISELGMNDKFWFKNKCGGKTRFVQNHIAQVLEPDNTSDTLGGPWTVSTDADMTRAEVCKQGTSECVSWELKKC